MTDEPKPNVIQRLRDPRVGVPALAVAAVAVSAILVGTLHAPPTAPMPVGTVHGPGVNPPPLPPPPTHNEHLSYLSHVQNDVARKEARLRHLGGKVPSMPPRFNQDMPAKVAEADERIRMKAHLRQVEAEIVKREK